MKIFPITKSVYFVFAIIPCLSAQEMPNLAVKGLAKAAKSLQQISKPVFLANRCNLQYENLINNQFLQFAQSAGANPFSFLENVPDFYSAHCQAPENSTLRAYLQSPILNIKKSLRYLQVLRSINKRVYIPHAQKIVKKMNQPIDPDFVSADDAAIMHDYYSQKLEILYDDPQLAKQVSCSILQEWPFYSIHFDLQAYRSNLVSLRDQLERDIQSLPLVEQLDSKIQEVKEQIDSTLFSFTLAANIINHRERVKEIEKNPLETIKSSIKSDSLKNDLESLKDIFPIPALSFCIKSKTGLPLIHSVCLAEDLSLLQKQKTVSILLKREEISINEHDQQHKTVLDHISSSDELYQLLVAHKAIHSHSLKQKPVKSVLVTSYDTPPSSPEISPSPKVKRTVAFHTEIPE